MLYPRCQILIFSLIDWAAVTREIALDPSSSGFTVYAAEKKLAEQVAWAWADEHKDVEVSTGASVSRGLLVTTQANVPVSEPYVLHWTVCS